MKKHARYEPVLRCAIYKWDSANPTHLEDSTEEINRKVLADFYNVVKWVLQHYEECVEITSNTISPATQNIFIPLREYRVLKNGHYRLVKICQMFLGGILVEEY